MIQACTSDYRIIFRSSILIWYKQLLILGFCFLSSLHCSSLIELGPELLNSDLH